MDNRSALPHVRQPEGSQTCGIACLLMVYNRYGIEHGGWSTVQREVMTDNCKTYLMTRNAMNHELPSMAVSAKSVDLIRIALDMGLEVLISYHSTRNTPIAHWSVVSDYSGGSVYINDPNMPALEGFRRRVRFDYLRDQMRPRIPEVPNGIVAKYTMILIQPPDIDIKHQQVNCYACKGQYVIFPDILEQIRFFVCPYCAAATVTDPEPAPESLSE